VTNQEAKSKLGNKRPLTL